MANRKTRTWLLLRGLTRGRGHWADFPNLLQSKFPEDQIIFLDLLGNGENHDKISPWRISEHVEFLREEIRKKPIQGALQVVAISLAAMIVVEWMKMYPQEIEKAYLINTSLRGSGAIYERMRPENYLKLAQIFQDLSPLEREKLVLQITSRNLEAQEKWVSAFANFSSNHPVQLQNFFRQLAVAAQAKLPNKNPGSVKIIISKNDNFVNSNCGLKIANTWGISAIVHPWAGHDLTLDDPKWVVDKLD